MAGSRNPRRTVLNDIRQDFSFPRGQFPSEFGRPVAQKVGLRGNIAPAGIPLGALPPFEPTNRRAVAAQLRDAKEGKGPTVFDWLVEIIRSHETKDGIVLELRSQLSDPNRSSTGLLGFADGSVRRIEVRR